MKFFIYFSIFVFFFSSNGFTQKNTLPSITIKNLKGSDIAFSNLFAEDTVTTYIVSFWATWCSPCIKELDAINDNLPDWETKVPVKLLAVSTDDSRTINRVKPFVAGRGWDFDVYTDVNSDLRRSLNIPNVPFTMLIKNGKIIYQHEGYLPGSEDELFEKIKK